MLDLLSKFSSVDRIYKINKNILHYFYYFFDKDERRNPLKDEIYDLQKKVSDNLGQRIKEYLLRYYHDNNFLDLSLVFIDGHVIAYFGKEAFQKLKHTTRGKIMKALEVFNFSDKKGRIFYFRADHDVEGMSKNVEKLLDEVNKIMGLEKIEILAFDRGGFCGQLFHKIQHKYKIELITLAVQNPGECGVKEQIKKIRKKIKFRKLKGLDNKKYGVSELEVDGKKYRALLILNMDTNEISPFITTMNEEKLSNEELLTSYSMHWRQEQEHNAFIKIGGDMHAKPMQSMEFDDTTKIERKKELKNKINRLKNETIRFEIEIKRLKGKKIYLTSKIKPKSKQTDNKLTRRELEDINKRLEDIKKRIKEIITEIKKAEKSLKRIPENPKKKKYKDGPVDYSISIVNLANNLNSKIVEIFSKGEKKYQLATLKSSLYNSFAKVWENEKYINIEFINVRQERDIEGIWRLCEYFNARNVKLYGKIIRFSVNVEEENTENKMW